MSFDPITAGLQIAGSVIDKIFPDPIDREKAKLEMAKLNQDGKFKEIEIQMSAIIAEAKSSDPFTSRARPCFLYVFYILILFGLPMGILSVFNPEAATQVAAGMKAWLGAIPGEIYTLAGVGYLGYTGARSWDKRGLKKTK